MDAIHPHKIMFIATYYRLFISIAKLVAPRDSGTQASLHPKVVPRESIFRRFEAEAQVAGTAAEATKAHSGDVKTHIHPGCLERDPKRGQPQEEN